MNNAMGKLQGRALFQRKVFQRKEFCMYVVSIVAYQDSDFQDRCRPHKKKKFDFTHVGLSAHAHNNYCARG